MGVERNGSTDAANGSSLARCNKTTSVDIYRPPALRLQSNELSDSTSSQKCDTKIDSLYTKSNSSISCNNSPTHANENNKICNTMTLSDDTAAANENSQQQISSATAAILVAAATETTTANATSRRERRPDRAVYIPRARRSQTTPPATTTAPQSSQQTANHVSVQQLAITSDFSCSVSTALSSKVDELSKNCSSKKIKSNTIVGSNNNKERKERMKKSSTTTTKHKTLYDTTTSEKVIKNVSEEETKDVKIINKNNDNITIKYEKVLTTKVNLTNNTEHIENNISPNSTSDIIIIKDRKQDINNYCTTEVDMATSLIEKQSNSNAVHTENSSLSNMRIEDVIGADRIKPKCDIEEQELQRASKEINRSNRRIMKQSFISDVLEIPEKIDQNEDPQLGKQHLNKDSTTTDEEDEDDWENMFDESGECLDPKILEELTASVGKVKIELPKMDYSAYLTKQSILNDEEFPHVLEVSSFPVEFKNQDLLMVFSQYKESGFDIKWVDDTHALAVFSSSRIAAEVLAMGHPFVVLKPLAEATLESRLKAKKCAASLQPYRPRPETCAALARRLVTGALGVRLKTAAAERENEKRVLREAKERKLLAAKQRDEVWES